MDNSNRELIFLHGNHRPQCNATVDKHFIGYYTLQYVRQGEVELFYDDTWYILRPGTFWAGYPGPLVRFHPASAGRSWDHRYIAFTGSLVQTWESNGLIPRTPVTTDNREEWTTEMDNIIKEAFLLQGYAQQRAVNRLENILYSLAESQRSQAPANDWAHRVIDIICAQGYFPDYSLVAEKLHLSERTLRRRFHRLMGISVHEYMIQLRLQKASALLWGTDLPINEIAEQLGYRDIYFFSRQFRNRMQVTPTEFRRSRQ